MAKTLNTSHPLYNNIVRALKGDDYKQEMYALDGKGGVSQQGYNCRVASTGLTFTAEQGIAFDGTHWFATNSSIFELVKYDTNSNEIVKNSNPFANLPGATDHIGDVHVDANYVYAVCDNYSGGTATVQSIVRYNKTDLTYHSHWDIHEAGYNASGICIANGELVVSGFEPTNTPTSNNATKLRRFNLSTGAKIGEFTLSQGVLGIQGLVYTGTHWFLSSYQTPGDYNSVYVFDDTFTYITKHNPIGTNVEMEGLEFYNGRLYFHVLGGVPQELLFSDNMYISRTTSESQPVKFLDAADIGDTGSIVIKLTAESLFNFNSILDNLTGANDWEAWIYGDGRLAWRVDSAKNLTYSTVTTNTEYLMAFTWSNSGGTVTTKIGLDGVYVGSTTGAWKTPRDLHLGGANASNDQGDNVYHDVLVYDKVLSDAELADLNTNFDNVYASGGPEQNTVIVTAEQLTQGQVGNVDIVLQASATQAQQDTQGQAASVSETNILTATIAEQLTQSQAALNSITQAINAVVSQQLTQGQSTNLITVSLLSVSTAEQLTQAQAVSVNQSGDSNMTAAVTELITQGQTVNVTEAQPVTASNTETITQAVPITLSDGDTVIAVITEQLTQGQSASVDLGAIANLVTGEQLNEAETFDVAQALINTALSSEQLTEGELAVVLDAQLNIDPMKLKLIRKTDLFTFTKM